MNIQKWLQNRQQDQISNVLGQGTHSKLMTSYKGRDSTYSKALESKHSIYKDVKNYFKVCENCQEKVDFKLKANSELLSMPFIYLFIYFSYLNFFIVDMQLVR